jgi:hypothetical protein
LILEGDEVELEEWLSNPLNDEGDCCGHLGRQLGFKNRYYVSNDTVSEILLFLVKEIEQTSHPWPPPDDLTQCRHLAELATRDLTPLQLYSTLLEGSPTWRRKKLGEGSISSLPKRLQAALEDGLTTELSEMLGRWKRWNVPELEKRREEMVRRGQVIRPATEPALPRQRPSFEELREMRALHQDDYTPPGRS